MMRDLSASTQGVLSYFTRHKTLANLLMVFALVAGLFAFPNMRAQFFPDVVREAVTVSVLWEGAGAEDVDAAVVEVLEPSLLAVEGVDSTSATSREGLATLSLEFESGWPIARAVEDVQAAIDTVTGLPQGAEEPVVRRAAWRDRVTDVVITGPVSADLLGRYADEFTARLFAEGVTRTTIRGLAAPRIMVEVPSLSLIAHDVTMAQIAGAIAAQVDTTPAASLERANSRIRIGEEKRSPEAIAQIILRSNPDGSALRVGDIADLRLEGAARARSYFVGDDPAVSIRVDRSAQGDSIEIQRQVEAVAAAFQHVLPEGVRIDLIRTRAEAISGRLDILLDNGVLGLGLVVLLLFLFLNARTAFWVAAGIPVALSAAIGLMYLGGLTLNMISLFALILTLGIVVDDAIVVGEHADYRHRTLGEPPFVAAENAARRMAMPVFAASVTTVIAFYGLVALGGRFGGLIQDIPFTVIAVLVASLVECFLILPHHMAHALARSKAEQWYDWPSRQVNRGFDWVRAHLFRPAMVWGLRARYAVLAGVTVLLASQVALVIQGDVQWRFFNAPERGSVTGNFAMVEGATRADSMEMMRHLQTVVAELGTEYEAEYGRNPVAYVLAELGGNAGRGLAGVGTKDPDLLGGISIELIEADLRPYSSFAFVAALQDRVVPHPLVETVSFRGGRAGPGGDAIHVEFLGAETQVLKAASVDLQQALSRFPEVSAVEDSMAYDRVELILDLTPKGRALGFDIESLGRDLRNRLAGIEAATFPQGPRSAEIRVTLPDAELTADFLERTFMRSQAGVYVPLADIVRVRTRDGFSTVRRENGVRVISVTGDLSEDDPARAEEIKRLLEAEILPNIAATHQITYELAGLAEQEDRFLSDALLGLILSLLGIYLVLAWIFASWTRPLVVLAVVPFGLVGTIYGHWVWDVPLSMFTIVGLLGMTGIIINDSIVLVTTIDQHAQRRGIAQAIVQGAVDRLRPVLLTTLTTVLGLAPLLYEQSQQAQFLKPTVITLVYGLGFGMVLVLLLVPALLGIQEDFRRSLAALRRGLNGPRRVAMPLWVGAVFVLAWLGCTLVWVSVTGELPPLISNAWPDLASAPPMPMALLAFVLGLALVVALLYPIAPWILRQRPDPS